MYACTWCLNGEKKQCTLSILLSDLFLDRIYNVLSFTWYLNNKQPKTRFPHELEAQNIKKLILRKYILRHWLIPFLGETQFSNYRNMYTTFH